jgi:hypothetical protein
LAGKKAMKEYFDYSIRSALPSHPESPASVGAKFLDTLDALSRIDQKIFTNWKIMDFPAVASFPLAAARPRIATIIENNVARDDLKRPEPYLGYTADAFTDNAIESRNASLRIRAGGGEAGETMFETGRYKVAPDPGIVTCALFKAELLAINAIWPPPWACAYAFRVNYYEVPLFPGAPLFPYSRFHIPWIAYLSAPLIVGLVLPPDILTERAPGGGLLMSATEERLEPTNPEHLRRARVLAEILIKRTGYSSH